MLDKFPRQKKSSGAKNLTWAKECIEKALDGLSLSDNSIRTSYENKIINYNLVNDILDEKDIHRITNPYKIKGVSFPAKMQNYPVALPKIDLLVGEESKRIFDWKVVVVNRDAVSEKDKQKVKYVNEYIKSKMKNTEGLDKSEIEKELEDLIQYTSYTMQDFREKRGTAIMNYYWSKEEFARKFNEGIKDVFIAGEENYSIDIIGKEPKLRKVNPLNLTVYRSGESPWLQDADIIIERGYYSHSKVIDTYYDYLKPSDIDKIETGDFQTSDNSAIKIRDNELKILPGGVITHTGKEDVYNLNGEYINPSALNNTSFGSTYDEHGNLLVSKVTWASYREIGILTSINPETGEDDLQIVDRKYEVREDLGETVKWLWVKEYWEGDKIGAGSDGIYVKIRRKPSYRNPANPSTCHSGYVGLAYNINSNQAMSLLDRMKPYQYLYNVLMYRTELAFAKSHGKIMRLPLHEIPKGWTMDKYLAFAFGYNISVYDAFKEGTKGAAMGKLAGNMQQNRHEIDLEMGSYIQQHIDMMSYIKEELGEISGVSKARQGQISERSAVSNVQREVTQSSHITEKWFMAHDLVKKKVMEVFLDTAIYALKNNPLKSQIVMGDMLTEIFEANEDDFNQAELGIFISDSTKDGELLQTLKQMSGELAKSQQIQFGELAAIFSSNSISGLVRKIENAQKKRNEQQQQSEQKQVESTEKIKQEEIAWKERELRSKLNMDKYKIDTDLLMKQMELERDGITIDPEQRAITLETLRQNQQKIDDAFYFNEKKAKLEKEKLEVQKQKNKKDAELKQKQINKPVRTAS